MAFAAAVAVALLLLLLLQQEVVVLAQPDIAFSACPSDVVDYFKSLYPEYSPPGGTRRRRMAADDDEDDDLESQLFGRTKLMTAATAGPAADPSLFASAPQTTSVRGGGGANPLNTGNNEEEEEVNEGPTVLQRATPPSAALAGRRPQQDKYLAPPNAWQKAKMALSGCTSCSNGCCDATDIVLECGRMSVPLNYTAPGDRQISLMTYRVRATGNLQAQPTDRKQLWMLQGGPGGSGLSILFLAVPSLEFATDIYIPDHRGTGLSSTLTCPTVVTDLGIIPPSSAARCVAAAVERGADGVNTPVDPRLYTVTSAARDLAALIHSQHQADVPVYVHGYSYGTRWASRLLQLFPTIANKVVLEGNVAKTTVFNDFAAGSQAAGTRFMAKCQLDVKCRGVFTKSVREQITAIARQGQTNPCSNLFMGTSTAYSEAAYRMQIQQLLFQGLSYGVDGPYWVRDAVTGETRDVYVDFRTVFLSLVSRWSRCTEDKANYRVFSAGMAWYFSLFNGYVGVAALDTSQDFSDLVYGQIVCSELRRYPVESEQDYTLLRSQSEWGVYDTYNNYLAESNNWEPWRYNDSLALEAAAPQDISADLLMLNGEIDGNTFASQAMENYADITTTASKRIAIVPDAGHHASGFGCGQRVTKAFYHNSSSAPACGQTEDLTSDAVLPLGTEFDIPSSLSSVLIGNPPTPFHGDVAVEYCLRPPTSQPTASGAAKRYCRKCFDYCIFLNLVKERTDCSCAQDYGACLDRGRFNNAGSECLAYLSAYGSKLRYAPYMAGGSCRSSCAQGVEAGFSAAPSSGVIVTTGGGGLLPLLLLALLLLL